MINLTIQNNYIQFGGLSVVMWLVKVHTCTCFHVFLVGAFIPFTFKVIIDMYDPIGLPRWLSG